MYKNLIEQAIKARENAHAPYSNFKVGAALLAKNGQIFTGCNIENASYPVCNCGERTAFFKAVSEGVKEFTAIAIVGGKEDVKTPCAPCGVCRQVMSEFCDADFEIVLGTPEDYKVYKLSELLPLAFEKSVL